MKRLLLILPFFLLSGWAIAQEGTLVVDSLESLLSKQKGRERIETMLKLSEAFYELSFDDCIAWGEKAINEAKSQGYADLEADANHALGEYYGYHIDLDLSYVYLNTAYEMHESMGDGTKAFEDIWRQAYFEHVYGNVDTALCMYEKVLSMAEQRDDTLGIAKVNSNKAILQYQKQKYQEAEITFKSARKSYDLLNDSLMVVHIDANLACLYMEWGKAAQARNLFLEVIPKLEAVGDYGWLIMVYKNYGQLFVKDYHDFDSASYYYGKAYSILELLESNGVGVEANSKVDILVELGNALYNDDNYKEAEEWYLKAFELAESSSYASGQMMACLGLGMVYSYLSQPVKSLHYLNMIDDLESKSGITIAYSTIKLPLILNYARLGKFDEMGSELKDYKEQYDGLLRENSDLYEQISSLQDETQWLRSKYDTQANKIETLYAQRNQYRLAFFGLLAIALFALAVWIAYKIVRKNRVKNVKS